MGDKVKRKEMKMLVGRNHISFRLNGDYLRSMKADKRYIWTCESDIYKITICVDKKNGKNVICHELSDKEKKESKSIWSRYLK